LSTVLPLLLSWLQEYGYPALWLSIFAASVGVPLPIGLVLLAAGAFAALGDFDIALLTIVAVTASTCGDSVGYLIGRLLGHRVLLWLAGRLIPAERIKRSQAYFKRRGAWAIFLSRFLFSAFGGVVNLLAGAEEYPYRRFLVFDVTGETIGALLPLLLGYVFGVSWEAVGDILGAISLFALTLLFTIYLIIRLIKMIRQRALTNLAKEERPDSLPVISVKLRCRDCIYRVRRIDEPRP
jgi:membrane-associated protein